jgi:alpha-amylase
MRLYRKSNISWLTLLFFSFVNQLYAQNNPNPTNSQIVLQGFWWDYWNNNYPNGWSNYLMDLVPRLKALGIDAVWIPPSIKNNNTSSVGYAPFDHYDLGDKFQKGSLKTRLGDKDELLRLSAVLKANGIDLIQDLILNHVSNAGSNTGAGGQDPAAMDDGLTQRYKNFRYVSYHTPADLETTTNYLGRTGRFPKNWQNFYPNNNNPCCTNDINTAYWGPDLSYESNAYGLSSNAIFNPSQNANYVRDQMRQWLIWNKKQIGWDGVRLDAVKHFPNNITEDYLWNLQNNASWASGTSNMFAVGEWVGGVNELDNWCNSVQNRAGTFDFSLRNAFTGIVSGNGNFNLGSVPGFQQQNRQRTMPFVNNHDTFRPTLSAQGNYTGWNASQQLGSQIEPGDVRSSVCHAIAFAVDGSPLIFFEDLFNIGYLGNRWSHLPGSNTSLPVRSDIANIIWCHQNLRFKEGSYMVRWQAADALVIERASKAIIGVNDQFSLWQNLVGVQTSWPDGTILVDYSGANTQTITVYGGGKIDFNIPPCNGTAGQGRKGYCIWGPQGITQNYWRPAKRITQEWEMDQDLGDRHINSLQQGGKTPDNSFECRLVGRFFAKNGHIVQIDIYPGTGINALNMDVLDKNCQPVSSVHGVGNLNLSFTPTEEGWYNIRIRNGLGNTPGQKAWVKVNYMGGDSLNSNVPKSNCSCLGSGNVTLNYKYANSSLTPISQSSSQLSINQTVIRRDTIASGGVTNLQSIAANVYNLSMTTSLSWNGVTSTDALLITRAFANLFSLSEIQKLSADVNQSLSVNASDALLITRRFTGIINSFPSGDWVIYPNRISVITGQNNTQEIKVLNSGDVNGSRVGW